MWKHAPTVFRGYNTVCWMCRHTNMLLVLLVLLAVHLAGTLSINTTTNTPPGVPGEPQELPRVADEMG